MDSYSVINTMFVCSTYTQCVPKRHICIFIEGNKDVLMSRTIISTLFFNEGLTASLSYEGQSQSLRKCGIALSWKDI